MSTRYSGQIVTDSLYLIYDPDSPRSFNGGSAVYDISGNGNHASITGSVIHVSSSNHGYFSFPGLNACIISNNNVDLVNTGVSVGVWFRKNGAWTPGYEKLISFSNSAFPSQGQSTCNMMLSQFPNGTAMYSYLKVQSADANGAEITGSNVSLNEWHYIVSTYDGTECNLYFDGVFVTGSGTLTGNFDATTGMKFMMGWSYGSEYWEGDLSHTHYYRKVLSATEVLQNYNATKGRFL